MQPSNESNHGDRWRVVWVAMTYGVALDFVLGLATILAVPFARPSALVPAKGQAIYLFHAAVGVCLGFGGVALVIRSLGVQRTYRASAVAGILGLAIAGVGGALTADHGLRLVGMALMLVGSPVAGFAYLTPAYGDSLKAGGLDSTSRGSTGQASPGSIVRSVARVVLVDPTAAVLLLSGRDPAEQEGPEFWYTPGGGAEEGETLPEAASREVYEETGYRLGAVGPVVHRSRAAFDLDGMHFDQDESYFFVRCPRFAPNPVQLTELERRSMTGSRWWRIDELLASNVAVYPVDLARLVAEWLVRQPQPYLDQRDQPGPASRPGAFSEPGTASQPGAGEQ